MITEIINTSCRMRRIKNIEVHEAEVVENIRPQQHLALLGPFGTGKNKLWLNKIMESLGKDCIRSSPSRPAILGTISKDGEYNPGALVEGSGKVIMINEFTNLKGTAREALLEPMEDGYMVKDIGFAVRHPISIKTRYCRGKISKGRIMISNIWFTLVTGMMYWPEKRFLDEVNYKGKPMEVPNQNSMALMSRFTMLPVDPNFDQILDMLGGYQSRLFDEPVKVDSWAPQIDNLIVNKDEYMRFHNYFRDQAKAAQKGMKDWEKSLLGRIQNTMLRIEISRSLFEKKCEYCEKLSVASLQLPREFLTRFEHFLSFYRLNYLNYSELQMLQRIAVCPDDSYKELAQHVDLSRRQAINVVRSISEKMDLGSGEIKE